MNKKENFLEYFKAEREMDFQSLYTVAVDSLNFATQINIFHWQCESGFIHTHLEEVYKIIRDFADELVEITLGTGAKFKLGELKSDYTEDVYNQSNMERKLRKYIDELGIIANKFQSKIAINNLISDTIQSLEKEYGLLIQFS